MVPQSIIEKMYIRLLDTYSGKDNWPLDNKGFLHTINHTDVDYHVNMNNQDKIRYANDINIIKNLFDECRSENSVVFTGKDGKKTIYHKSDRGLDEDEKRNFTCIGLSDECEIITAYPIDADTIMNMLINDPYEYKINTEEDNKKLKGNEKTSYNLKPCEKKVFCISSRNPVITYEMIKSTKETEVTIVVPTTEIILSEEKKMDGKAEKLKCDIKEIYDKVVKNNKKGKEFKIYNKELCILERKFRELNTLTELEFMEKDQEYLDIEQEIEEFENADTYLQYTGEAQYRKSILEKDLYDKKVTLKEETVQEFLEKVKIGKDIGTIISARNKLDIDEINERQELIGNAIIYIEKCLGDMGATVVENLSETVIDKNTLVYEVNGEGRLVELSERRIAKSVRLGNEKEDEKEMLVSNLKAIREFEADEEHVIMERYFNPQDYIKEQESSFYEETETNL